MLKNDKQDPLNTCLFSLEGALLASLAVCTAASADAASGVARRISQMSCWHSLCFRRQSYQKHINQKYQDFGKDIYNYVILHNS